MRTFVTGDRVHVATLGTGIVREARNGGRYLIELKGRSMVVAGSQLEPAPERRAAKRPPPANPHPEKTNAADSAAITSTPSRSLDLHGKTVLEALDALDSFLNDALLDGCDDVRVIHGRSGGKVKAAVYGRLAQLPSVRAFRVDPTNPGVTVVRL
jgi:dsDNA-specific endonuclease/ATPase MutS2